ncbi:TetR family transcriptional regulator [Glycomyces sp. NRRL B-16210]|uniref:acyl-CoA-like ligand-binding transcription factor n=1 Tax=Glycomyces sp. NRRL B-16210 TaxID=1463821 RepID=UPI0004C176B8|nr:TetR family transcriptional regulator [Glycomyces sp. NRRL B-16210]
MRERQGLREQKRRAAMRRVQDAALGLFDEHGFEAVTIEQIAAAAEVSPSSVYRYFATKEGIVLYDPNEIALEAPIASADEGVPFAEVLHRTVMGFLSEHGDEVVDRRRAKYLMEVPSVQDAVARRFFTETPTLAAFVAARTGRSPDDLEVRVACGAFAGGMLAAMRHWHAEDYAEPLGSLLDRTLATMQHGLEVALR